MEKSLLTKVTKGIEYGDVSNQAIRNILTMVSRLTYGKFTEQDMEDAINFFDGKCPYTGRDIYEAITKNEYAVDHIVPQNRQHCGLNVMGNLVLVDKKANSKKSNKTVEEFILNNQDVLAGVSQKVREERLKKIRDFQKAYNYNPEQIKEKISPILEQYYSDVRSDQEERIDNVIALSGLSRIANTSDVEEICKSSCKKQKIDIPIIFYPADEEKFKQDLIKSKKAMFTLNYGFNVVKKSPWRANNFTSESDLRSNIYSKTFWRNKEKDGLLEVKVEILH